MSPSRTWWREEFRIAPDSEMLDVLIIGAGPAGAVAATVLARAGVTVRLVDRARFPREKLCGDTINPGTLAILDRLGLGTGIRERGMPIAGWRLTGESGVQVSTRYGPKVEGRAISRRDLDWLLLRGALAAGAQFDEGTVANEAIWDPLAGRVAGARIGRPGGPLMPLQSRVTIAADGRRSRLAFSLGLARHPARPRRWAIGSYWDDVEGLSEFGEMHVRRQYYIGVAQLPGGIANACLVRPWSARRGAWTDPEILLKQTIASDPELRERFSRARRIAPVVSLGPLAVDVRDAGLPGLLLAGDAAGFIDPMTGDGLRFAVRGGELAAEAALEALGGDPFAHCQLTKRRVNEFVRKWRFNRAVRALVGSATGVRLASATAGLFPEAIARLIVRAGDVDLRSNGRA